MEELCNYELEKRTVGVERLSPHDEIEDEINSIVSNLNISDLSNLQNDIKLSLSTDSKFAKEYQYWNCLL